MWIWLYKPGVLSALYLHLNTANMWQEIILYVLNAEWYFPLCTLYVLLPEDGKCLIKLPSLSFPVKYQFLAIYAFICILLIWKLKFGRNGHIWCEAGTWHSLQHEWIWKFHVRVNRDCSYVLGVFLKAQVGLLLSVQQSSLGKYREICNFSAACYLQRFKVTNSRRLKFSNHQPEL